MISMSPRRSFVNEFGRMLTKSYYEQNPSMNVSQHTQPCTIVEHCDGVVGTWCMNMRSGLRKWRSFTWVSDDSQGQDVVGLRLVWLQMGFCLVGLLFVTFCTINVACCQVCSCGADVGLRKRQALASSA